jgi:hypothetical protein
MKRLRSNAGIGGSSSSIFSKKLPHRKPKTAPAATKKLPIKKATIPNTPADTGTKLLQTADGTPRPEEEKSTARVGAVAARAAEITIKTTRSIRNRKAGRARGGGVAVPAMLENCITQRSSGVGRKLRSLERLRWKPRSTEKSREPVGIVAQALPGYQWPLSEFALRQCRVREVHEQGAM